MSPVTLADVAISPDGRRVAKLTFSSVGAQIEISSNPALSQSQTEPTVIPLGLTLATSLDWITDDRITVDMLTSSGAGHFTTMPSIRTIALSPDGAERAVLFDTPGAFNSIFNHPRLVHRVPGDNERILMSAQDQNGARSLYDVDLRSGLATLVEEGQPHTALWLANGAGKPGIRIDDAEFLQLREVFARDGRSNSWTRKGAYYSEGAPPLDLLAAMENPRFAVIPAALRHDKTGLFRYDLFTNRLRGSIYQRNDYDIEETVSDPHTGQPIAARYFAIKPELAFFDNRRHRRLSEVFSTLGPEAFVVRFKFDENDRWGVVQVESPKDPGSFHLVDARRGTTRLLSPMRPQLSATTLAAMSPYSYTARDGLQIQAYLTVPPNTATQNLPLILMPHGGPEARDVQRFDSLAQYLASRGYAVFQPNFRGSSGYGQRFAELGYREWGGKMQDDLIDGLDDLIAKGIVDQTRVCILGSSYGGYAALAAAMLTPERFQCAVSIAGVSDLIDIINEAREEFGAQSGTYGYVRRAIGRLPEDRAELIAKSPARNADKFGIPILLAHGVADRRVALSHSLKMRDALIAAGKPVDYIPARPVDPRFSSPK